MEKLYSIAEAAQLLNVGKYTIRYLVATERGGRP